LIESQEILKIEDLHLSFGGVQALHGVSLAVRPHEILAIIGPNGAGKTCILNCVNAFYRPQKGRIFFNNIEITRMLPYQICSMGIARVFQNVELYTGLTTLENLMAARHSKMKQSILSSAIWYGKARKEEVYNRERVELIIDFLEIQSIRNQVVGMLPYGLRKRVELGRALALEPKLLLLDEPMAGMNLEEKEDMARFVLDVAEREGFPVVLIEHDMGVVMDIADRIVVINNGEVLAEGTPAEIGANPKVAEAYMGSDELW
jgi:branched-chain amino acid transport system ATP-binding protein